MLGDRSVVPGAGRPSAVRLLEDDAALYEASEEFAEALSAAEEARRRLRRKVLELVAHEELQHSPG